MGISLCQLKTFTSWDSKYYLVFKLKYEPKYNITKDLSLSEMNYKSRDCLQDENCNKIFGIKKNVLSHFSSATATTNILSF